MDGQTSIFDGKRNTDYCLVKPEIGEKLVCYGLLDGDTQEYPCVVEYHCGYDFFWVRFIDKVPRPETEGWHLSLRAFKEHWRYMDDGRPAKHMDDGSSYEGA